MKNQQSVQIVLESRPCPDLKRRLAKIYQLAILRGIITLNRTENNTASSEVASNNSTALTQNTKGAGVRAD